MHAFYYYANEVKKTVHVHKGHSRQTKAPAPPKHTKKVALFLY
jgi:hypothetical protein